MNNIKEGAEFEAPAKILRAVSQRGLLTIERHSVRAHPKIGQSGRGDHEVPYGLRERETVQSG